MKTIYLAGGCFWGVEAYYKKLKGVVDTQVGYANGNYPNPTYEEVCDEKATHAEAVKVVYDAKVISLEKLLDHLFRIIDPTSVNKQGHDEGVQYRTGVYFETVEDEKVAKAYVARRQPEYKKPIAVEIQSLRGFYDAETYHQDYLDKNPFGYCHVNFAVLKKEEMK
ncbi:MAG: peptide-methionine (S)-S-oxide reductase MsrA [Bacilli bacterium]